MDFSTKTIYAIGEPLDRLGLNWEALDASVSGVVLWKFDSSTAVGCDYIQTYKIDLTISGLFETFFAYIMDFKWTSQVMIITMVISSARNEIG